MSLHAPSAAILEGDNERPNVFAAASGAHGQVPTADAAGISPNVFPGLSASPTVAPAPAPAKRPRGWPTRANLPTASRRIAALAALAGAVTALAVALISGPSSDPTQSRRPAQVQADEPAPERPSSTGLQARGRKVGPRPETRRRGANPPRQARRRQPHRPSATAASSPQPTTPTPRAPPVPAPPSLVPPSPPVSQSPLAPHKRPLPMPVAPGAPPEFL